MSEQGHAKNIANFDRIISVVTGFDAAYNPPNSLISIAKMQIKSSASHTELDNVALKDAEETIALNERFPLFDSLETLTTRIIAAAAVSINDQLFSSDLRTIARKLQGRRAKSKIKDDPATPDVDESKLSISASQMSFENRMATFAQLIALLKTQGSYNPNEDELKITSLETLLAGMQAKHTAAVNKINAAKTARISRNEVLYNETEGIITRAGLVKLYVKSVFGAKSPQYEQIAEIKFKKP